MAIQLLGVIDGLQSERVTDERDHQCRKLQFLVSLGPYTQFNKVTVSIPGLSGSKGLDS